MDAHLSKTGRIVERRSEVSERMDDTLGRSPDEGNDALYDLLYLSIYVLFCFSFSCAYQ